MTRLHALARAAVVGGLVTGLLWLLGASLLGPVKEGAAALLMVGPFPVWAVWEFRRRK